MQEGAVCGSGVWVTFDWGQIFSITADIFVKILVELLMILVLTFSKIKVNFKDFGVIFNTLATFLKSRWNFSRFRWSFLKIEINIFWDQAPTQYQYQDFADPLIFSRALFKIDLTPNIKKPTPKSLFIKKRLKSRQQKHLYNHPHTNPPTHYYSQTPL